NTQTQEGAEFGITSNFAPSRVCRIRFVDKTRRFVESPVDKRNEVPIFGVVLETMTKTTGL
ncbi:hypothetical protein LJC45_05025, partial [Alistipes sp. OttesenSCG-928-B03]|nr:hypothetical protein [Alistipes sp. OttesenSCG-928-B03]